MIDGLKATCVGLDASVWRDNPLLEFHTVVSEKTGEAGKSVAKRRSITFVISKDGVCSFRGSLHKHYNGDDTNHNDFTHADVIEALDELSRAYSIDLQTAEIHGIEAGVNLTLDCTPYLPLKSAVCHKQKPFNLIDKNDKLMGKICEYQNYRVKMYDKSRQQKVKGKNILRPEVRFIRMSIVHECGIKTLSDLKDKAKIRQLGGLLLDRLDEIVFFDFECDISRLSEIKQLKWKQYRDHNFWDETTPQRRYKAKQKYKELIEKYNAFDWEAFIHNEVACKWDELLNDNSIPENKADNQKKGYVIHGLQPAKPERKKNGKRKDVKKPCYCVSCGRDISNQRAGSRFCSETLYGKDAKRCRNKDSNRRNAIKRKLLRTVELKQPVVITYASQKKRRLKIKETDLARKWLDKIVKVEVLTRKKGSKTTNSFTSKTETKNMLPMPTPVVAEKTWRNDYEIYLSELREAYVALLSDHNFISERERYHPNLNIRLSIEKACVDFWATEEGWKHKKESKYGHIDWKSTLTKSLNQRQNKVWKQKNDPKEPEAHIIRDRY